jgi:hypothetical protein
MDLSHIIVPDFDEEEHVYRVDGRIVPSVTQIIELAGIGQSSATASGFEISEAVMEAAAERGTIVHRAIELDSRGELDDDSLDEETASYVSAWREFVADTGFVAVASELRFYERPNRYAGTIDLVGYIGDEPTVIDIKTGSVGLKPWHQLQLAAYARPLETEEWPNRIMLHLRPELKRKKYRDYHFRPETINEDLQVFLAALKLYWYKRIRED